MLNTLTFLPFSLCEFEIWRITTSIKHGWVTDIGWLQRGFFTSKKNNQSMLQPSLRDQPRILLILRTAFFPTCPCLRDGEKTRSRCCEPLGTHIRKTHESWWCQTHAKGPKKLKPVMQESDSHWLCFLSTSCYIACSYNSLFKSITIPPLEPSHRLVGFPQRDQ